MNIAMALHPWRSFIARTLRALCHILIITDLILIFRAVWLQMSGHDMDLILNILLSLMLPGLGFIQNWLKQFVNIPSKDSIQDSPKPVPLDDRGILLNKVREYWIEGVLKPALIGDVRLELESDPIPDVVQPRSGREFRSAHMEPITLDSGETIAEVFRRAERALLILGEPGSGKTITLLELAQDLLDQAEQNLHLPVPVVLNLASWAAECPEHLEEWLVERLHLDYGVSRKLGERWVADGDLLFLLDGLDEVPDLHRAACVAAINAFWQQDHDWADNGIVVCSRVDEYKALDNAEQLRLENAIILKSLTLVQATEYLTALGKNWFDLRAALPHDPVLREFAGSPLLLNMMAFAYQKEPVERITGFASIEQQKHHLMEHYTARRLRENTAHPKYSNAKTRHYLSWLASKLLEHEQIVFHIEELQPTWLETEQQRRRYLHAVPIISGLGFGLGGGLVVGLGGGLVVGLVGGLGIWLVVGLFGGLDGQSEVMYKIVVTERLIWSWRNARDEMDGSLGVSLVVGLGGGLFGWLFGGLVVGLFGGLFFGLVVGLVIGLFSGLGVGLVGGLIRGTIEQRTIPNQGIWSSLRSALTVSLVVGLFFGLFFGLVGGLVGGLVVGLVVGLVGGLVGGLFFGLVGGLFGWLFGGLAIIQHTILRYILWRSKVAPLNYAEFLRYTSSRHLTRQVGGGFIFRHRMLMEYFAEQLKVQ